MGNCARDRTRCELHHLTRPAPTALGLDRWQGTPEWTNGSSPIVAFRRTRSVAVTGRIGSNSAVTLDRPFLRFPRLALTYWAMECSVLLGLVRQDYLDLESTVPYECRWRVHVALELTELRASAAHAGMLGRRDRSGERSNMAIPGPANSIRLRVSWSPIPGRGHPAVLRQPTRTELRHGRASDGLRCPCDDARPGRKMSPSTRWRPSHRGTAPFHIRRPWNSSRRHPRTRTSDSR